MVKPLVKAILVAGLVISTLTACEETAETPSTDGGGGSTTNKAVLSSWSVSNSAWAIRLDVAGNITGTPFTMVIKFADASEMHCDATLNGTEASGTYSVSNCVSTTPGTSAMSASNNMDTAFETNGTGSYVNNGSSFYWCRANNACFTYN